MNVLRKEGPGTNSRTRGEQMDWEKYLQNGTIGCGCFHFCWFITADWTPDPSLVMVHLTPVPLGIRGEGGNDRIHTLRECAREALNGFDCYLCEHVPTSCMHKENSCQITLEPGAVLPPHSSLVALFIPSNSCQHGQYTLNDM